MPFYFTRGQKDLPTLHDIARKFSASLHVIAPTRPPRMGEVQKNRQERFLPSCARKFRASLHVIAPTRPPGMGEVQKNRQERFLPSCARKFSASLHVIPANAIALLLVANPSSF